MNLATCTCTYQSTENFTSIEELNHYDLLSPNILTLEELIQILEEVAKIQQFED